MMGGNALDEPTVRLDALRYHEASARATEAIRTAIPGLRHAVIPSYGTKDDYGDLDILVENSDSLQLEALAAALGDGRFTHNGPDDPIVSYGIPTPDGLFQVDLVGIETHLFDFAYRYYAMNDLGNFIGRIARRCGFKLGRQGLVHVQRSPKNDKIILAETLVTADWAAALSFLGYDPAEHERGLDGAFRTLEDLFDYAVSSRFASKDAFDLSLRNYEARRRDSGRKNYMALLAWLPGQPLPALAADIGIQDITAFRQARLDEAFSLFPEAKVSHEAAIALWQRNEAAKGRMNGAAVAKMTGLAGKNLNAVMRRIWERFDRDEARMLEFALNAGQTEIDALVLSSLREEDGASPVGTMKEAS